MTYDIKKINAVNGGEAYIITSGEDAVLIDVGYGFATEPTIANIEKALDGRELKHVILSHSHYDHVMGLPAITEHFTGITVYAHPKTAQVFASKGARKAMEDMDIAAAIKQGCKPEPGQVDKLRVDKTVTEGDIITIGNMQIRIIETPGHTKCAISPYFINEDLLFASETLGISHQFPEVVPGFIVSYEDTINSLEKIIKLHPQNLLLPHSRVITGEDVMTYLNNSVAESKKVYRIISEGYKNGKPIDDIFNELKQIYFHGNFAKFQPDEAFSANWYPMIHKVIATL